MAGPVTGNLFAAPFAPSMEERIEILLRTGAFRLERIISAGQATPPGEWLDQDEDEWVVLLSGGAGILFEEEGIVRTLRPGDHILIPAHTRHRVEWTDRGGATVWLAVHYRKEVK